MTKYYCASLHQLEDWYINYTVAKEQPPNIMRFELKLPADADFGTLAYAYQALIQRHESLRTSFPLVDGQIRQQVNAYDPDVFGLMQIDTDEESALQKAYDCMLPGLKDITKPPLAKGAVWGRGKERVFFFVIHHILADSWSIDIIRKELEALYIGIRYNRNPTLPDAPQLGDYLEKNRQQIEADHQRALRFWQDTLADKAWSIDYNQLYISCLGLAAGQKKIDKFKNWPAIRQADLYRRPGGQLYRICMDTQLTADLRRFSRQTNLSMYSTLIACISILGARLTGNANMLIRSHFNNRPDEQAESIVGNFIGSVFLYHSVDGRLTFKEFVAECYQAFMNSTDTIIYNSERLEPLGVLTRCLLHFNFINKEAGTEVNAEIMPPTVEDNEQVASPLFCAALEYSNTVIFRWGYHGGFFDLEIIKCLVDQYFGLLQKVLHNPDSRVEYLLRY